MVARGRWAGLAALFVADCASPDSLVHLRYMAWGNPQQLALERRFCDEFAHAHPGVAVDFIQTPSSAYANKMVLMLASRTAPDVMRVDHYNFAALAGKDYFRPLDDLAAGDRSFRLSDYIPSTVEEGRIGGKLYGLNVLFGAPVLYVNEDLVRKAGLEDPYVLWRRGEWTPDAYLRYAEAMSTVGRDRRPLTFGSWISGFPHQCAMVYAFGGDVMRDGRVVLAEGRAREALRFLHDLRFVHHAEPDASQAANSAFTFESGKIGMMAEWMGITPCLREAAKFSWDVCPFPRAPGGTTLVKGNQLVMNMESHHPALAWEFMKFMTGREVERKLYVDLRRCFPTRKDVAFTPDYLRSGDQPPHHLDAFVASVRTGRTLPITSRWSEWTTEFNSAVEPLFNGTRHDVDAALKEAQDRANASLAVKEGL